jgi:hypothetical protein
MNRILPLLSSVAFCVAASAQCFETNFGTQIGLGDDTLLAAQAIGFNFPMAGVNHTHIIPNTNGAAFLHTAATGALGTTATGYSTSAATMLTNLRGAAGGAPRLAAYWRDLNLTAANSGAVWVNTSVANRCVVTWANAVHFGQTSPVFTFQMQLLSTGEVRYFYSPTTQNTALGATVGVSNGGGIAAPASASDLSAGSVGTSVSPIVYQTFTALNTFDLQNSSCGFVPNAGLGYDVVNTPCVPAQNQTYGVGCPNISATAYESFAPNTIDLSNTSIRLTPNAQGGYTFGAGSGTNYTHTVAGLALGDDAVGTLALPVPFNYPGGTTSTLTICSNGYIWMQSPNTLADFSPTAAEMFSNPARLMPMWCDGVPDGTTNVANVFAEVDAVANKAYVTYSGIPIFGGVGGTMNVQCELDLTSGVVEYRYGAISCGNVCIVGWTPGTGFSAVNAGSIDISAQLASGFSTKATEQVALALATTTNPIIGNAVTFNASNIPATSPISVYVCSAGQTNPGIDLGSVGAPGCFAFVSLPEILAVDLLTNPTAAATFTIPADPFFAGQKFYSQAVSFDASANAFGMITSNGIASTMNAF